jgi:hypothetical protein
MREKMTGRVKNRNVLRLDGTGGVWRIEGHTLMNRTCRSSPLLGRLAALLFSVLLPSCGVNLLDRPEESAALAPKALIVIDQPVVLSMRGGEAWATLQPGTYRPLRRFSTGTIYMKEDKKITIAAYRSPRIGGIYWKDGTASPGGYCYYLSEFIPTIEATTALGAIRK